MEFLFQIGIVILLVLLNGYFVASEFALVAVRKTRIDELVKKGNAAAKLVQKAILDLDSFISATQLGITLASLALGWIGEPAIAHFLEPHLQFLPKDIALFSAHTLSIIIAFSIITFLHIVLGELAPKTVALQKAELTSLFVIAPLSLFTTVFRPFIWILNSAGSLVLRIFGFSAPSGHQLVHSEEEIKMLLTQSAASGIIPQKEVEMVYSVFRLGDIPVKQIMIPRTDIIAFNVSTSLNDIIKRAIRHPHSRFPVYEHSIDTIIGFIHIKDIYKTILKTKSDTLLSQTHLIRVIISVPETKRIDEVLRDMRNKRIHIAVVNDEYGGTAGIITLEDVIESLVGEIQDEFDQPLQDIQKQKDDSYLVDGAASIEKVQNKFRLPMRGQGYTTIGGLVFGLLGREPKKGDQVQIGNIVFTVEAMEKRRIKTLRLKKEARKKSK
ncbi:MAG: HlyC/CorC family transporter [Candidatus Levybacteria bacterium]|nr:HlyC/CorC family transporter [Candidatus Levybacteria bacterium]